MAVALLAFPYAFAALLVVLMRRNNKVHQERLRILDGIRKHNDENLEEAEWMLVVFKLKPSHTRMLFEVWRPVASYWKDQP